MRKCKKYSTKENSVFHDFTDDDGIPMPRTKIKLFDRRFSGCARNGKIMARNSDMGTWSVKHSEKTVEKSFRGCRKMKGKR